MRCVLGTLKDKEIKNINVEAIADGTNFGSATAPGASQKLTNNVKLQCSNSATASAPDPACDKTTKTDVAVS
jgi:spore coat protein U-like protein